MVGGYLNTDIIVMTFSGLAHSGKDTSVEFIKEEFEKEGKRVFCLAFGDYLKSLCRRNFGYDENNKEEYRDMLQNFGTDVVRAIEEDFWVRIVYSTIDLLRDIYDVFLISDARFLNELQPFPWHIGYPIFNVLVQRGIGPELTDEQNKHSSESLASDPPDDLFHIVIHNDKTMDDLQRMCENTVEFVLKIKKNNEEILRIESEDEAEDIIEKMLSGIGEEDEIE